MAQTATLRGVLLDELNNPIENATISANLNGTISNSNGFYILEIPSNKDINVEFSHINHKPVRVIFHLRNGQEFEFNPVLKIDIEQIETVVITGTKRSVFEGVTTISPEIIRTIKGAQPGVEFVNNYFSKDTHLWIAAIDKSLNEKGYIVPGLGDAGDLSFGEKLQH
mgnify:CR=1 FL=1